MNYVSISVIIPHYNCIKYLKRLCNTIPNSEDIEILVIDDKSNIDNDEIKLFSEELSKRNGRLFYNTTEKKGPGICRNIGLDNARGEWIVFADADDYFTPNAFDFFCEKVNSNAEVIYSYPMSVKIDTGKPGSRGYEFEKNIKRYCNSPTKEHLFYILFCMNSPCMKMIRKELIDVHRLRYGETMVSEDVMFSTKVGYYARGIEVCEVCTYCITESEGGTLSTTFNANELCTKVDVFVEWYEFLSKEKEKGYCPKYYLSFPGGKYVKRAINDRYGKEVLKYVVYKYHKAGIRWWVINPRKIVYILKSRMKNG